MHYIASPPALEAPRHNLLGSANNATPSTDQHWENGVTFSPRGCYVLDGTCTVCNDEESPGDKVAPQACPEAPQFFPYTIDLGVIWASHDGLDIRRLATEDFEIGTSSKLEDLIWNGCAGVVNPVLSDAESLGAAVAPAHALGRMLAHFINSDEHTGARGTLHMSPLVAVALSDHLKEDDGRLYTKVGGHLVVVGNYDPNTIVGHTGGIDVYLSEPFLTESPETIRRTNDVSFRVERLAVATWNTCAVFSQDVSGLDESL